jgi:hypothetical protein
MIDQVLNPDLSAGSGSHDTLSLKKLRLIYIRYFFVGMACLFPLIVMAGFVPEYLAMTAPGHKVNFVLNVHGAIMGSWLFVFLSQTVLAAKGNFTFHRKLGLISVLVGILVLLNLVFSSIYAKILYSSPLEDVMTWEMFLLQSYIITLFALLFTWGILARKHAARHKRLLLMATVILLQAAVDRISFLPGLYATSYNQFIYLDALFIPLFIYDFLTVKRIHKITIIGLACIVSLQFAVPMAWHTAAWDRFSYNLFAPFMEHPIEAKLSNAQIAPVLGYYGDSKWRMAIIRKGDKVYLQLPDQPKFEMAPITETEWFLKTATWRVTFVKSKDGHITKIINKQTSTIWEVPRSKQQ